MNGKALALGAIVAGMLLIGQSARAGQKSGSPDTYDEMFARYLAEAKAAAPESTEQAWSWLTGLARDRRALQRNDLITIRIVENIVGSGTADAAVAKSSGASISLPKLFGLEKKLPSAIDPTSLVSGKNSTDFKGSGTTTRAGELTAQMSARVADVLPNGDLVVEGVHEVEINGDRQIIVLSGVVRPTDISPNNVVASPSIGQLRIRYFGRGLLKDNLQPGWLIRVLNKVF